MDVHALSTILKSSKGYLSFNTSTQQIEIKGSHFLGKLVVWIRYKTSDSYRHAVEQAARQLVDTMALDTAYRTCFREKMSQGTPEFLKGKKPISARQVYGFILDIKSEAGESQTHSPAIDNSMEADAMLKDETAEKWISKLLGRDGSEDNRMKFNSRLNQMFEAKIENKPGLHKRNVRTDSIIEEIYQAALNNLSDISDEADADELIDTLLSSALDKYIAHAQIQLQERLQEHLSEINLPKQLHSEIETAIASMEIGDPYQLDQRIIALFLEKTDDSFDDLVRETAHKYRFEEDMLASPDIKEQLLQHLKSYLTEHAKDDKLSMTLTHSEAVKQLNRQRLDLVKTWVERWVDVSNRDGREFFKGELDKSLAAAGMEAISAKEFGAEVGREILENPKYVAAIESEDNAKAIILNELQVLLKPRIEQAHLEFQKKLHGRLQQANLPNAAHRHLDNRISKAQIKTMEQLNKEIKDLVVGQIDSEFESLFMQVKKGYRFEEEFASVSTLREQVRGKIVAQDADKIISIGAVRKQAIELLEQWLSVKIEALRAIESSRFSEVSLKKLVLQEPYMTKNQVEEFQQAIEQTLNAAYEKYANSYEAQFIEPQQLFSKLEDSEHRNALYDKLSTLVQEAVKPASMLDDEAWHANGIDALVREHIADVVRPTLHSYRQVEHLSGLVPDSIYREASKAVTDHRKIWGPDLIASINGLYINTLKDDNNAALYELLESPEIALQVLGVKSDQTPFTFKDLVESSIKKGSDVNNAKERHKAIDQLIPAEEKNYLLKGIENDLLQPRDGVISKTAAGRLFQESVLSALQNTKMDFERKEISFKQQAVHRPHYETTV